MEGCDFDGVVASFVGARPVGSIAIAGGGGDVGIMCGRTDVSALFSREAYSGLKTEGWSTEDMAASTSVGQTAATACVL